MRKLTAVVPAVALAVLVSACSNNSSPSALSSASSAAPTAAMSPTSASAADTAVESPSTVAIASSVARPSPATSTHSAAGSSTAVATSPADGVCAYLPVSTLGTLLGRNFTAAKSHDLPSPDSAAYCDYSAADDEFYINVATTDPADATDVFNQAAGGTLKPGSGIGDRSLAGPDELVVVFGQVTIAAGTLKKAVTADQLAQIVTAVHAAM
jgi:hypothetical protein